MTTQQKAEMYRQIQQHGENLNAIFNTQLDPVTLCKKLHRLERKAHQAAENLCNTNSLYYNSLPRYDIKQTTEEEQEQFFNKIEKSVLKILGEKAKGIFFINFDPRGYALKIRSEYVRANNLKIYQDWGGYGIISPDFTPVN